MSEELRALHDRMGATTVYVTHDQLEAMQMGDKIVVMNHGVVEQFGRPQEIYDWPATMFVASFLGSPAMNFLEFDGQLGNNQNSIHMNGADFQIPSSLEGVSGRLAFGVRPEHVRFSDSSSYKGEVLATEYLGTTQIVTIATPNGTIKSRMSAALPIQVGETPGLEFDSRTISLFNVETGRALLSQANQEVLRHG